MRKTHERKTLQGKLSITRNSLGVITIELEDKNSSLTLLEIEMTPHDFALALTNLSSQPCQFTIYGGVNLAGKKLEVKREKLQGIAWDNFETEFPKAIIPYQIDGWEADIQTSFNSHNCGGNGYAVVFRRYIDLKEGEA